MDASGLSRDPPMQNQLYIFKDKIWNTHRIRKQKDAELPAVILNHMYSFPQEYEMEECVMPNLIK